MVQPVVSGSSLADHTTHSAEGVASSRSSDQTDAPGSNRIVLFLSSLSPSFTALISLSKWLLGGVCPNQLMDVSTLNESVRGYTHTHTHTHGVRLDTHWESEGLH